MDNLDQVFTYHYFLKPFDIPEYRPLFTKTVNKQVEKVPFKFLLREPYVLTSNWAPNYTAAPRVGYTFLSPIANEYLKKIKELSVANGFTFIILPTPTNENNRKVIALMNRAEIAAIGLDNEFKNYFERITYLNDQLFYDGTHLKEPAAYTDYYERNYFNYFK